MESKPLDLAPPKRQASVGKIRVSTLFVVLIPKLKLWTPDIKLWTPEFSKAKALDSRVFQS
jgi:hypothetical protein